MSGHTPGPWTTTQVPIPAGSAFRIGSTGTERAWAWIYADGIRKGIDDALPRSLELAANARLIAAAPEMLSLLVDSCERMDGNWRERRDALFLQLQVVLS